MSWSSESKVKGCAVIEFLGITWVWELIEIEFDLHCVEVFNVLTWSTMQESAASDVTMHMLEGMIEALWRSRFNVLICTGNRTSRTYKMC